MQQALKGTIPSIFTGVLLKVESGDLSVEGFGSDFAKFASYAPDSLKEKDHRISISLRAN